MLNGTKHWSLEIITARLFLILSKAWNLREPSLLCSIFWLLAQTKSELFVRPFTVRIFPTSWIWLPPSLSLQLSFTSRSVGIMRVVKLYGSRCEICFLLQEIIYSQCSSLYLQHLDAHYTLPLLISFHTYCSHTEDLKLILVSEKWNKKPNKNTLDACVHVTLSNPSVTAFYCEILWSF